MKALPVLLCIWLLIGCAEPVAPKPDIPLPADKLEGVTVYKDIKDIRIYKTYITAFAIVPSRHDENGEVISLSSDTYKIVYDAVTPWWEEQEWKTYCWVWVGRKHGTWQRGSSHRTDVIIHLNSIKDAKRMP